MISVITGASAGIGAAAAEALARAGHDVVLVGRSRARLTSVAAQVTQAAGRRPDTAVADFASFEEVTRLAADLLDRYQRIDVLANNAGVMAAERRLTRDGHELMMQVNHLSPFLLTNLLLPRVTASGGRVVTTSSGAAKSGRLDPADLSRARRRWSAWLQYGDTKQANALFTVALARRGVAATCFHPGIVRTGFAPDSLYMKLLMAIPGVARSPEQGAGTLVHLATTPDGAKHTGRYFANGLPASASPRMTDVSLAAALWDVSLAVTGLSADEMS
ncbi:oxidoreductase [Sphaerisporangium siamense]|uniref:NAD(P)-dependent dehydrogenase (Short-subunit alcohol dehydrogenase family) n=1 Tax=Sphaerisporangium siamense TaxID=795645 RepID=A0A7W7D5D2_9ACTN|nr:SDR family NAD(P)-dependent oxidoreductase [Sphaerisporangium siamense]MBB4699216.1 NAD(P)-dependent dehydrogenase (short-subunit alcohol dehydrogenase family) [Sphaerisporangium siamense]GII86657.1 oxidoreductase [Sphaerisporangium siamense]